VKPQVVKQYSFSFNM